MRILTELQRSALLEAGNIGSGHSAIALSQLMGKKIMIAIPAIELRTADDLSVTFSDDREGYINVRLMVYGDVRGAMLMNMKFDMACVLCDMLLGQNAGTTKLLGEMELSAIMEAASILSASYLNAVALMTEMFMIISTPTYGLGSAVPIKDIINNERNASSDLLCIKTEFLQMELRVEGQLIFPFW